MKRRKPKEVKVKEETPKQQRLLTILKKGGGQDQKASPRPLTTLRSQRPDPPPDRRGLPCMGCEEEVAADDFTCIGNDYWICPRCVRILQLAKPLPAPGD